MRTSYETLPLVWGVFFKSNIKAVEELRNWRIYPPFFFDDDNYVTNGETSISEFQQSQLIFTGLKEDLLGPHQVIPSLTTTNFTTIQ